MSTTFNPREHLMQIKNRQGSSDYLPVQWRLVWFRQECPDGTIETEIVHLDMEKETEEETFVWNNEKRRSEKVTKMAKGIAVVHAVVKDGKGGIATGTKMEKAASFPDYLEKAETGSIGRALAALGYGTQFTGEEFNESHRIVDSPVDRQITHASNGNGYGNGNTQVTAVHPIVTSNEQVNGASQPIPTPRLTAENSADEGIATEQQVSSIRKLCEHLGKAEPDNVTSISYLNAKKLIQQLTTEYKESRQSKKAS